jgi:chromosome partitioning protein
MSAPSFTPLHDDAVTVLLAGPQPRIDVWYQHLAAEARFRVLSWANTQADLHAKLAARPEVVLLDAAIYPEYPDLLETLTRIQAAVYVVLPPVAPEIREEVTQALQDMPVVKGLFHGDVQLLALTNKMYGDARALRKQQPHPSWAAHAVPGQGRAGSLRIIAVWNQIGGVGKTTVSTNLAYEAARRGHPTLLVGLGAPDDLPLILGLKAEPNLNTWRANPTPQGFKASLQKVATLDVIAGFPDVLSEGQMLATPLEAPESIQKLVMTAAYAGYATIVMDCPPSALAAQALVAANHLVMVARPALEGVWRTVEAYKTVVDQLSDQHQIPASAVYVVLNRVQAGHRVGPEAWHRGASEMLGRAFPPVIAQIEEDVRIGDNQDQRRVPLLTCDTFARNLQPLADTLLGEAGRSPAGRKPPRVIRFGPLKIKVAR